MRVCAAESYVYTTYASRYIFIGMLVSEGMRVNCITVCEAFQFVHLCLWNAAAL